MKTASSIALALFASALLVAAAPSMAQANSDCLACHADAGLQDASGHGVSVDGQKFGASIHGSLECANCHATIKGYPHPEKVTPVKCDSCHADQAAGLAGSVHSNSADHPCTSCHGDAHSIFPKSDPRLAVYPLNVPRTCGNCHGNDGMAKKHGLASVYPLYVDSIHGFALSKEGLLVAANCQSCHGSHHILSRKDRRAPPTRSTFRRPAEPAMPESPTTTWAAYMGRPWKGHLDAPVCSDCHTAHSIEQPTADAFRMQSTPICGNCHKDKFTTYRDTFHSQLGSLGGYVETARCWDCHGAHGILPASDPNSPVAPANLVKTCGRCHAGANASFVQYQPHANARNRKLNPALYFVRLFMNLLLAGVLTFFVIHTILWLIRSRYQQIKSRTKNGGDNA